MSSWSGVRDKRVLITGATGGIGLAAAEALAARGARLAIVARNAQRAAAAQERIAAAGGPGAAVDALTADLSSMTEVRSLGAEVLRRYPRIDVVIHNAGAIFTRRELTVDGIERTWALNHLAPFLLTTMWLARFRSGAPARIVTTSSAAHQRARIPWGDLRAERRFRGFQRYGQSKLANILFTVELARRLHGTGATANCFHPGLVATGFGRNNGKLASMVMGMLAPIARSPARGADTLVWLADSAEAGAFTGRYFVDRRTVDPDPAAADGEAARRLWDESAAAVAAWV